MFNYYRYSNRFFAFSWNTRIWAFLLNVGFRYGQFGLVLEIGPVGLGFLAGSQDI